MRSAKPAILIIDGEQQNRQRATEVVNQFDLECHEVDQCQDVLQRLTTHSIELIILNMQCAGEGAITLLRSLNESRSPIPVILITPPSIFMQQVVERYSFVVASIDNLSSDHSLEQLSKLIAHTVLPNTERRWSPKELTQLDIDEFAESGVAEISQQLMYQKPSSRLYQCQLDYSIYSRNLLSPWFVSHAAITQRHTAGFLAFSPVSDHRAAVISAVLQANLNRLRRRRKEDPPETLQPELLLQKLAKEVRLSGLDIQVEIGFFIFDGDSKKLSISIVGSHIRGYLRHDQQLTPMMLRSATSLIEEPLMCAAITKTLSPDDQFVLFGGEPELKERLLQDKFEGFIESRYQGGFLQLSCH
ncbi:response regulator [Ferrimonas aestuarii]|uniref:Response regulator n=1 Tax=Ferrimonas aestuarii TaxID=2569539 RepID=A0A4U1BNW7_9GAMM|nr:response regulator [Ferrimonas aestuarii]TKB55446.1 response regulator [Ferrimonas aestuarii]